MRHLFASAHALEMKRGTAVVFALALTLASSSFVRLPAAATERFHQFRFDNNNNGDNNNDTNDHTTQAGKQIFRFDTFGDEQFWTDGCSCTTRLPRSIRQRRSRLA